MEGFKSAILGVLGTIWFAYIYPYLFEYLFIDMELDSIIVPCKESYSLETCTLLVRLCLWLMELPVLLTIFGSYTLALVYWSSKSTRLNISVPFVLFGYVVSYILAIVFFYRDYPVSDYSYYIVPIITHSVLIILGAYLWRHLTRRSSKDAVNGAA